jgi:hypothetical protein
VALPSCNFFDHPATSVLRVTKYATARRSSSWNKCEEPIGPKGARAYREETCARNRPGDTLGWEQDLSLLTSTWRFLAMPDPLYELTREMREKRSQASERWGRFNSERIIPAMPAVAR